MYKSKWMVPLAAMALASGFSLSMVQAQEQDQPRQRNNAQNRQRGGDEADREARAQQFRQQAEERMKSALGVNNEEWAVVSPLIEKVRQAQGQTRVGRGGMMGGPRGGQGGPGGQGAQGGQRQGGPAAAGQQGGPRGGQAAANQSPVAKASGELNTALQNENSSPETIQAKLQALREAKKKAQQNLAAAQEELRGVLTPRQEAQLVVMGLLD